MRSLKLAWDNTFARRNQTGTGVYASRLLEQLATRSDIEVTVLEGWPRESSRIAASPALRTAGNLLWTHLALPEITQRHHVDILHSPAFVAPVSCFCPTVITVHDVTFLHNPAHFSGWWVNYLRLSMPKAVDSAAAIICGSEHSKGEIVRAYRLPDAKVHVVPYGVDHQRFSTAAALDTTWARSVGIEKPYVLHVGVFSERKNIPVLLRAVATLRDEGRFCGHQLVLAGKEAPGVVGARSIEETIQKFKLQDLVLKVGHVPDNKLAGLYAGAALLVMPSMHEGFGFPVLEAMATGTPVITSNVSSLSEVAGDAALLVSPGDTQELAKSIHTVLEDNVLRESLRTKGLAQAQKFSWGRAAEETVKVYRMVARI